MEYIGNAFSPSMIRGDALIRIEAITREEFCNKRYDAISIIGHPEIAEHFGLKLNRQSILLYPGDELYIVMPRVRPYENKRVENGAKYEFVPEEKGYIYKKITVEVE